MVGERAERAPEGLTPSETYGGEAALHSELARLDFVGQLLRGQPPKLRPIVGVNNLPTASVERRGTIATLYVDGAPDELLICLLTDPGPPEVYEWVSLGAAAAAGQGYLYIPANAFESGGASMAPRGSDTAAYDVPAWGLDTTTIELVNGSFHLPGNYDGGAVTIRAYLAPSTSDAGGVRLNCSPRALVAGDQIDASTTAVGASITMPGVADQLVEQDFTDAGWTAWGGKLVRLVLHREPAHGADTYPADVWLIGARIAFGTQ